MNPVIQGQELSIRGAVLRTAVLRHEWCDFLADPATTAGAVAQRGLADLFTFVTDLGDSEHRYDYHCEPVGVAALKITTFDAWWEAIGKKKRNQIRKAQKSGVELREVTLDRTFATGIEALYNECPVRQGRKFYHYGQTADEIQDELSSFPEQTIFVGAYVNGELVGFMKLFKAAHALRVVHILAKLSERDKCVMDALIGRAVELAISHQRAFVHYGTWVDRGIGAFRTKHCFERLEVPRYYIPLNWRGRVMLQLRLHQPLRDRLPNTVIEPLIALRTKWNAHRFPAVKEFADA